MGEPPSQGNLTVLVIALRVGMAESWITHLVPSG
jgi:hypothetical protein